MEKLEKVDVDAWLSQLLNIDQRVKKLEYDLRVAKATKAKFEEIAKNFLNNCSRCGCKNLGVYKSKSENGAVFYCCNEHVPFNAPE